MERKVEMMVVICGVNGWEWLMCWLLVCVYDNGLFILFSNGIGVDDDEVCIGNVMILDFYGCIINEIWEVVDVMVSVELDLLLILFSMGWCWIYGCWFEMYFILI